MLATDAQTSTRPSRTTTRVASAVIHVLNVDRSVDFYCDVFSCRVALREPGAAMLLTPNDFQIFLYSKEPSPRPDVGAVGVQYLTWATDSEAELQRITQRLCAYDSATYTYTVDGVTFVEARKPDHGRVIVAYPGPGLLPRDQIVPRFRGH